MIVVLLLISQLVGIFCESNYTFYNSGFTPQRLTHRHLMEEGLVKYSQTRRHFLRLQQFVIKAYITKYPKYNRVASFVSLIWKWTVLRKTLKLSASFDFDAESKKYIVAPKYVTLESQAEEKIGSHEMNIVFGDYYQQQSMTLLKPEKISRGTEFDTIKGGHLTVTQQAEISMHQLAYGRYYESIEWLENAVYQNWLNFATVNFKCPLDLIANLYPVSVQQHNRKRFEIYSKTPALQVHDRQVQAFFSKPVRYPLFVNFPHQFKMPLVPQKISNKQLHYETLKLSGLHNKNATAYARIVDGCLGNRYMPLKEQAKLFCYLDTKKHSYFRINPLYTEILSYKPELYHFHKLIGEKTIKRVIQIREWDLKRKRFTCGLSDRYFPFCRPAKLTPVNLFKTTEYISGLKHTWCSGQCHVVEQTAGRVAIEHNDHTGGDEEQRKTEQLEEHGDYLATVLYFLETPQFGAQTYFTHIGNFAEAEKGSAVFWYGMWRNGSLRYNQTEHCGCPVIHGGKIVTTHFIRYNTNWQTYRCSLDPNE